jgi:hypothetical protein
MHFSNLEQQKLPGTFKHKGSGQKIIINHTSGQDFDVYIDGNCSTVLKRTARMRLVKSSHNVLSITPLQGEAGIDAYDAWLDFALRIDWDLSLNISSLSIGSILSENFGNEKYERIVL